MRRITGLFPNGLVTGGTVLSAASGPLLLENLITGGPWAVAVITAALLVLGVLLFFAGTRWQSSQAQRLGVFMSAFAVGPTYDQARIETETKAFSTWAARTNPLVQVIDPVKVEVTSSDSLLRFTDRVENGLTKALSSTRGGHDVTLRVGGRLDACFLLGQSLRTATGMPGPIWVVSDCSVDYDDEFTPVAAIGTASDEADSSAGQDLLLSLDHHPALWRTPQRRERPDHLDDLSAHVVLPLMRFPDSEPTTMTLCLADGHWTDCHHEGRHATIVLAFDSLELPHPNSRVATALARNADRFPDPVLALTGMRGLGETPDAYARVLETVEDSAAAAPVAATSSAERLVAIAGPSAFAVALGARLGSPGPVRWTPLEYADGTYRPSSLCGARTVGG